ncbi:MAG: hypothetical protein HUU35_20090, partial [Armatimonadetes bacterium]|nr:hypothetical protein [Armatimonadota bacterium]
GGPAYGGTVTAVDWTAPAVTVQTATPLPLGEALAGQPITFHDSGWIKNCIYRIQRVEPAPNGFTITLEGPGFETAAGTVDEVGPASLFTKDSLEKLFNCHRLYDGKRVYTADFAHSLRLREVRPAYYAVGDVTLHTEGDPREHFPPGSRFVIVEVYPGCGFEIDRIGPDD